MQLLMWRLKGRQASYDKNRHLITVKWVRIGEAWEVPWGLVAGGEACIWSLAGHQQAS